MPPFTWRAVRAVLLLLAGACALRTSEMVRVDPRSTSSAVVFLIRPGVTIYGLSVLRCGGGVMWTVGTAGDSVDAPSRIVYGTPPPRFSTRAGPEPLSPGCYRVVVTGPEESWFRIRADGTLELPNPSGERATDATPG